MIATIHPSAVEGIIVVPAAKSAMQRACALALLNNGQTIIHNPGQSDDDKVAIDIVKNLGAEIIEEGDNIVIKSNAMIKSNRIINCGESGLSFRMFASIAALSSSTIELRGSGSLLKRPMHFIDETFPLVNVKTESNNGFLPIKITGPLVPQNISIDGSLSSQYLTGLLFAFARSTKKEITIHVKNLISKPYIDLSLAMLHRFGYQVTHDNYIDFRISPVDLQERNIVYSTEADWSSASFLLVAGAIAGNITLRGLDIHSLQADKAILQVLSAAKAEVAITNDVISVKNTNQLQAFEFDATNCPDLFPPLVALAAYCNGGSVIKGVSRLVGKESNRAESLIDCFSKMGIDLYIKNNAMIVTGGKVKTAHISSHHDHRIAMACAVAGLKATGKIMIHDAEVINKSYPAFFNHLRMLAVTVSLSAE